MGSLWFLPPETLVFSTNKTNLLNITEILLTDIRYPQSVLLVEETRVPGENPPCRKSLTNFIT